MEKVYVGKIVNYFGLKGELKVISSFEMPEKAFIKGNHLIINEEEHLITNVRFHHHNYLIEIDNLKDINLITKYIGIDLYLNKEELNLKEDEYLIEDLLNKEVYFNDKLIGTITDVRNDHINPLIKVNGFYIPLKGNYLKKVDLKNNKVDVINIEGLML